jgi:hypothetical protein
VVGHGGDDVGHSLTGYSEKIRNPQVSKDLLPSLEPETQALLLRCFTITAVPAYFIRGGRKLVEEEAA